MKQFFIIMTTVIVAGLCSCSNGSKIVILAAEEAEYNKCREVFPEIECIKTGVGAGNVIKTCCNLPKGTRIINIGYAGSNNVEIGTVSPVSDTFRYTDGNYKFDDHANPLHLSDEGLPCYTGNSFFTESDRTEPTLYDMELNYIASFSPHLELVAAVKIVSDNLSVDDYVNNAKRESGVLTSDEVWANVRQAVETILSRIQDKKR
ncbi:MAG: hypothetical protein KBS53_04665 [Bacteroidales bacterium]|nr:hypothetical protein [Candidatus Hennigimonas equi]